MARKVKIRALSNWSIVITVVLAILCVTTSCVGFQKYGVLRDAMQDYISYETAANDLQKGSDILTKQVRLAAATGDQQYIDAYFEEAEVTKNRERALDELAALDGSPDAMAALQEAMAFSTELMQTEYYSMRLVEESIHADPTTWPEALQLYTLSAEDAALSDAEKLSRAQQLVISVDYEHAKDQISSDVDTALSTLTEEIVNRQHSAADLFSIVLRVMIVCGILFAVMMLINSSIVRFWIVTPLVKYTEAIRYGSIFPVHGVNELQVFADTYNKVYEENEERKMLMKHQAEHDALTDVLNRGSFDRVLDLYEKDESEFALILIDVDTFKQVNDTYGHAVGDTILKKVAALLQTAFRSIDYVFRIGGDEFAVIMVNMTSDLAYTISDKISDVNRQLAAAEGEIPAVSLSVGVAFTDRKNPGESLFKDADAALYYTKEHARKNCNFYPVS